MLKNFKYSVLLLVISAFFTACSNKTQDTSDDSADTSSSEYTESSANKTFEFQRAFTTLEWTAYKTSDRVAVGGSFKEFEVTPGVESGSIEEILKGLSFTIPTNSSFSNDAGRDERIAKYFYGKMMNTSEIKGHIDSIQHSDTSNTAFVTITMNNESHSVECPYMVNGAQVTLKAHLMLSNWKADPAVQALNEQCDDLHKGPDGLSRLWPDVDVKVTSTLREL